MLAEARIFCLPPPRFNNFCKRRETLETAFLATCKNGLQDTSGKLPTASSVSVADSLEDGWFFSCRTLFFKNQHYRACCAVAPRLLIEVSSPLLKYVVFLLIELSARLLFCSDLAKHLCLVLICVLLFTSPCIFYQVWGVASSSSTSPLLPFRFFDWKPSSRCICARNYSSMQGGAGLRFTGGFHKDFKIAY